jgi:hypothetical protein
MRGDDVAEQSNTRSFGSGGASPWSRSFSGRPIYVGTRQLQLDVSDSYNPNPLSGYGLKGGLQNHRSKIVRVAVMRSEGDDFAAVINVRSYEDNPAGDRGT